jgi:hypothetical protein
MIIRFAIRDVRMSMNGALSEMKKEPNEAVERSRLLVADHAFACSAPSNRLAHLERSSSETESV